MIYEANKQNPIIIRIKGKSICPSIVGPSNFNKLEGWCNVCHQSTENFIIGKFIIPTIASTAADFDPSIFLSNAFDKRKIK